MKKILSLLFLLIASSNIFAASNSNPGLYYGQVPTPAQLNSYFSSKLDYQPGAANSIPYWDGAGNLLSAPVSGACTAIAGVFTCTATGSTNINGGNTGFIPYQSAPNTTVFLAGNTTTTPQFVTSTGTGVAAQAPTLTGSTGTGSVVLSASPTITGTLATTNLSSSGTVSGTGFSNYLAAPPAIGGTTPAAGSFTTVRANSQYLSPYAGRNRLINGGMSVDQIHVGASQTITAAAALAYTTDQWWAACTGANVTGQRVAGSNQTQYRYRFTGAASVTGIQFGQRIEAANVYDLNGQTATLSVELSNSLLTTVTWTAYYANTSNTFGTLASPTKTQIATGNFTVTSTPTIYSTQISMPANAANGVEIVFSVGAQTSGTWTISNVQLELGSVATPFEFKSFKHVLSEASYYYRKSYTYIDVPGTITQNGADVDVWINTTDFFDLGGKSLRGGHMFAVPAMTLYSTATGATGVVRSAPGADVAAVVRFQGDSAYSAATPAAGGTASQGAYWHWTASAYIP